MVKEEDRAEMIQDTLLYKTVTTHDSFQRIKQELAAGTRDTDNALYSMFILGVDFLQQQIAKTIGQVNDWEVLKVKPLEQPEQIDNTAGTQSNLEAGAEEKAANG